MFSIRTLRHFNSVKYGKGKELRDHQSAPSAKRVKIYLQSNLLSSNYYFLPIFSIFSRSVPYSFQYMLKMMTPFIKYLLLHPSPSTLHTLTSSHLHSSLLTLAQPTPSTPSYDQTSSRDQPASHVHPPSFLILQSLLHILPLTATHTDQLLLTASGYLQGLVRVGVQCGRPEVWTCLMDNCMALSCALLVRGLPLEPLLLCMLQLTAEERKVNHCIFKGLS